MSAVVRFSLKLGDQSDDAHEDRREEFEKFAKQWLGLEYSNPSVDGVSLVAGAGFHC